MTKNNEIDVLGIGNMIMDIIAPVPEAFLKKQSMTKGAMILIDEPRALEINAALDAETKPFEIAGGSAANTLAGIAELGVSAAYIGKIGKDKTGDNMRDGFKQAGLYFNTPPVTSGEASSRSMIAVTPDGERTMNTYLGASTQLTRKDISKALVARAKITYLEGYLFDIDAAKQAFIRAAEYARAANRETALTLSDSFCVDRHRDSFRHLVDNHVDILFANEEEIFSLFETRDLDAVVQNLRAKETTACITRSEKGSLIIEAHNVHDVPPRPVDKIVDTTGAGDQYAAGVLAGRAMNMDWADAGYLGSICAAEVISHYGARPETRIHDLIAGG